MHLLILAAQRHCSAYIFSSRHSKSVVEFAFPHLGSPKVLQCLHFLILASQKCCSAYMFSSCHSKSLVVFAFPHLGSPRGRLLKLALGFLYTVFLFFCTSEGHGITPSRGGGGREGLGVVTDISSFVIKNKPSLNFSTNP